MKNIFFTVLGMLLTLSGYSQFKNDNALYKTVDPADLCMMLEKNKDYLLLDVRSKGEHYDTSSFVNLNIGHFKGAMNIDVQSLNTRLSELSTYKDKPIFIYCSHSQRSRRASKILADSGFTKVYNINGGLSAFHYNSLSGNSCMNSLYETANQYAIISFNQLCEKVKKPGMTFFLDVRPDSAFRHISLNAKTNAQGTLKGFQNIPLADLKNRLNELPGKTTPIILVDQNGNDAAKAAAMLTKDGYTQVSLLIEGVDRILTMDSKDLPCKRSLYISPVSYQTLNPAEFGRYAKSNQNFQLIDIRTSDEFSNKHKDAFRNIGHLTHAINIPEDQLKARLSEVDKTRDILLYGFSSGPEVYRSAQILTENGYTKIYVLTGGIFNTRWASGNIKGQEYLRDFVVNVPEANL